MTFKVCNLGSKQPYFNRAYVVRVCTFFVTAVHCYVNTYFHVCLIECLPKGRNEGFWHKYGEITLKHKTADNGAHIKTDNVTNNLV